MMRSLAGDSYTWSTCILQVFRIFTHQDTCVKMLPASYNLITYSFVFPLEASNPYLYDFLHFDIFQPQNSILVDLVDTYGLYSKAVILMNGATNDILPDSVARPYPSKEREREKEDEYQRNYRVVDCHAFQSPSRAKQIQPVKAKTF